MPRLELVLSANRKACERERQRQLTVEPQIFCKSYFPAQRRRFARLTGCSTPKRVVRFAPGSRTLVTPGRRLAARSNASAPLGSWA